MWLYNSECYTGRFPGIFRALPACALVRTGQKYPYDPQAAPQRDTAHDPAAMDAPGHPIRQAKRYRAIGRHDARHAFPERTIFCDKPSSDMQEWKMHKLKHVATGMMLALIACGPVAPHAHAEPHGGGGGGRGGPGGGGYGGGHGGGWNNAGRGGGWDGGRSGHWRGNWGWGGWGWNGGWGGGYYPAYVGWGGWGYPWGGWGWGWPGMAMGGAMGAAAAGASYQAAPEVYSGTGNTTPEDDTIYDKDLSTLVNPQPAPVPTQAPAQPKPSRSCPAGQVYNDLTESCDRP